MRHIDDWDAIPDSTGSDPAPGGYIVQAVNVKDVEEKEYLRIEWDYIDPPFSGHNREVFANHGFWPVVLIRSYKEKAMPFFKGFKTSLEKSNRGYVFDDRHVGGIVGKFFGVVLGEEEYRKRSGDIGRRLYVHTVCSVDTIKQNDFAVPALKELDRSRQTQPSQTFAELDDDFGAGSLPFD